MTDQVEHALRLVARARSDLTNAIGLLKGIRPMPSTTDASASAPICRYCGVIGRHTPESCPRVASITYGDRGDRAGMIHRIEFHPPAAPATRTAPDLDGAIQKLDVGRLPTFNSSQWDVDKGADRIEIIFDGCLNDDQAVGVMQAIGVLLRVRKVG